MNFFLAHFSRPVIQPIMTKETSQHREEFPVAVVQQVIGTLLQHQPLLTAAAAACNLNLCSLAGGTVMVNALHNDLSDVPACSGSCKNVVARSDHRGVNGALRGR